MKPYFFSLILALLMVACANSKAQVEKQNKDRPNILFIAIDDMNDWTTLFDEGNPIKTPNLKRLANKGMFFSRAYSVSPACNPSRSAILTGVLPSVSGVYGNNDSWRFLVPDVVTLPQYFGRNGYSTKGAGKIFHHGEAGRDREENPSFEEFFDMPGTREPSTNHNGYTKGLLSKTVFDWGVHNKKLVDIDMVEWVENAMEQTDESPVFLAAGIFSPHLPFYSDQKTADKYTYEKLEIPPMKEGDLGDVPKIAKNMAHKEYFIYENTIKKPERDPGSLQTYVKSYFAASDFSDQMVGRLLDKLEATGKADNTIIVLFSDHGYHLGDKESCVKFTLWEKANHVPFIIVAPGITKPGTVCNQPVSLINIYATLIDLAGLPPKEDINGKSLLPLLKNPDMEWGQPALMTMGRGNHAIRSKRWRYISYSDGTEELYDHSKDPWEWKNLANVPEYLDVITQHKSWLPKEEVPWKIDESQNWIYNQVEWNDMPINNKSGE